MEREQTVDVSLVVSNMIDEVNSLRNKFRDTAYDPELAQRIDTLECTLMILGVPRGNVEWLVRDDSDDN